MLVSLTSLKAKVQKEKMKALASLLLAVLVPFYLFKNGYHIWSFLFPLIIISFVYIGSKFREPLFKDWPDKASIGQGLFLHDKVMISAFIQLAWIFFLVAAILLSFNDAIGASICVLIGLGIMLCISPRMKFSN